METFLHKALVETRLQIENLDKCKLQFKKTQNFFKFQPKSNNESEWPKEFFGLWISFCSDFKDIWKKEQQKRHQEQTEKVRKSFLKREAEKNAIVRVKAKPTGLKARLNKLRQQTSKEIST
ncbi:Formin-1, partial [Stegodyphus mimosarum]